MKRFGLLVGMIVFSFAIFGQSFYTIQVRSLSREVALTEDEVAAGMWQLKQGSLIKCFFGKYDTYEEAKTALSPLKLSQFKDAFVVSSDRLVGLDDSSIPLVVNANAQKVIPKSQPISKVQSYTVQVAAYRFPLYAKDFNLQDEIMEFYCNDNIYRYTVGKFESQEEAREYLKKIKESGYPDAFLIDYSKYEVYRIE